MRIHLLTVGRLKKGPEKDLFDSYAKRLHWQIQLTEIDARKFPTTTQWQKEMETMIPDGIPLILLDEKGKNIDSPAFADKIQKWQNIGISELCFAIGGADGFDRDFRQKAEFLLSFGQMTWPHMMARVMLIEQLYRAQQIIANHPYHRS